MSIQTIPLEHPISRCVAEISAALDRAAAADPQLLSVHAKKVALVELSRQAERIRGLVLKVLAVSDDVAAEGGSRSPAAWLAHHIRADHGPSARAGRLADRPGSRWGVVLEAVVAGRVSEDQARVIVAALDALPDHLDVGLRAKAEAHLVAEAAHFAPKLLRVLGRRVLDVIAPDAADDEQRRQLEAEERRARKRTSLIVRTRGDGVTDISIRVPDSPQHGATATSIVINLDYDQLRTGAGAANLSTGDVISAGEVRRLACTAGLIPAVLGRKSEPLDLGRAARLFSPTQAMAIRDKQCRAEACTIPAAWCEAHHAGAPWSRGGRTNLADGQLLCSFHHHRAHDVHYDQRRLPNGDVRFNRRR